MRPAQAQKNRLGGRLLVKLLHYNGCMDSTIYRFRNLRIAMFYGDHPPPHVHLLGAGVKVSIEIGSLKTKGRCDSKALAEAQAWIAANQVEIMKIWQQRGAKR